MSMKTKQVSLPIPKVGQKAKLVRALETDFAQILRGTRLTVQSVLLTGPEEDHNIIATMDKSQPSEAHQSAIDNYLDRHGVVFCSLASWSWYNGHGRDTFSVGDELSALAEFHMTVAYLISSKSD